MAGLFFDSGISNGFEKDLKRMNAAMNKTTGNIQKKGSVIDKQFKLITQRVGGLVSVLAIGAAGKELISFTDDLETALTEVATISQAVTDDFEGYKDAILALSIESQSSAKTLTEAYYDIVSAGNDGAAGLELLAAAEQASIAGFVDVGLAADGLTTVLNAWGKSASEAEAVSDGFFKTVEKGKTTFPELAQNMAQAAPIAASMGVSFEEVSAAAATITKAGTPTAQAFTQIRSSLLAVNEVLGDGWAEAMTYQEALIEVKKQAGGSTNKLKDMLGRVEAVNAVLGLTGKNAVTAAEDLAALNNSLEATSIAAEKVTETTKFQVSQLKNNILAALAPLGEDASGVIADIAENLNKAFQSGDIQKFAKVLLQLGKAFAAYKVSIIAINQYQKINNALIRLNHKAHIKSAILGKKVTASNLLMANSLKKLKLAFASNPIGLLITGLTLAIPLIKKFADSTKEVNLQAKDLADATAKTTAGVDKQTASLKVYQTQLKRTEPNSKERARLIEQLNKEYPDLLKNIDGESSSIIALNKVFESYIKNLEKTVRLKVLQSKFQDLINDKIEIEANTTLSSNESFKALQNIELRKKALEDEIIYQKNIVDISQKYADLIKEQTKLLQEQNEGGVLAGLLVGNIQSYEDFVRDYKAINSTLPDGSFIARQFSKEELDKAYLEEVNRQESFVKNSENTANRLVQIEKELQNELDSVIATGAKGKDGLEVSEKELLKALGLANQIRINDIIKQYGTEEKLQDEFNRKLLENELRYLNDKRKLTKDALEKAKIDEQILTTTIQIDTTSAEAVEKKKLDELLLKYKTYLDKRKDIQKKYEKEIAALAKKQAVKQIKEAKKAQEKELKQLDSTFAINNEKFKKWFEDDLPGLAKEGIEILKNEIEKLKLNIELAEGANTDEALKQLAVYVEMVKELNKKIKQLEAGASTSQRGDKILEGADLVMGTFQQLGVTLSDEMGKLTDSFITAFDSFSSKTASSTEKAAGLIGLIISVVNIGVKAVKDNAEAEVKALDAVNQSISDRISSESVLNEILRDRQKIQNESSAFLSANYKLQYTGAIKQVEDSAIAANEAMNALREGVTLTASGTGDAHFGLNKKTENFSFGINEVLGDINEKNSLNKERAALLFDPIGLFGGSQYEEGYREAYGKVEKAFESTLSSMGKTSADMAQFSQQEWADFFVLLDEGGLIVDAGSKALVATLRDNTAAYTEALEQMRDIINSIAGDLGTSLGDAIVNSIREGTDALDEFSKSLNNVLLEMAKAEVNEIFFRDLFDNLQMEMERSMAGGDQRWEDDILRFYDKLPNAIEGAETFLRGFDEQMKQLGFEGIVSVEDSFADDASRAGQIQDAITEETGSELVGRLGAIMLSNERIANFSQDGLDLAVQNLVVMNKIKVNTDYLPEIADNTRKTYEKLESI